MMRKGKGGRENKVPALMAPVITRQPALDGPQDDSPFNFVMVNFEVGRWSADLPEPGESQANTFFLRDPNELQTIDGPFNEKLCKEIPGKVTYVVHSIMRRRGVSLHVFVCCVTVCSEKLIITDRQ